MAKGWEELSIRSVRKGIVALACHEGVLAFLQGSGHLLKIAAQALQFLDLGLGQTISAVLVSRCGKDLVISWRVTTVATMPLLKTCRMATVNRVEIPAAQAIDAEPGNMPDHRKDRFLDNYFPTVVGAERHGLDQQRIFPALHDTGPRFRFGYPMKRFINRYGAVMVIWPRQGGHDPQTVDGTGNDAPVAVHQGDIAVGPLPNMGEDG